MNNNDVDGYDIIGDIHGCAVELEELLDTLGYRNDRSGAAYQHPRRQAIFVGDLIDRGSGQLRVLEVVKAMVDAGTASMVLGNHEFNALAYDTESPTEPGKYLRPHDDPQHKWSEGNQRAHQEFLDQVGGKDRETYLEWMWRQPLWLDRGDLRVVHACWHRPSIELIERELDGDRLCTIAQLARASDPDDALYTAIETILKGPEISLTDHDQPPYRDKDRKPRESARLRWWDSTAMTLRDLAEMGNFTTTGGDPYPELPAIPASTDGDHIYRDQVPVFYGHYWRRGTPSPGRDFTDYTACVDFSAIDGQYLTAYRWSGESRINPTNYVSVPAREGVGI